MAFSISFGGSNPERSADRRGRRPGPGDVLGGVPAGVLEGDQVGRSPKNPRCPPRCRL